MMKSIGVLAIATAASMSFGIARGAETTADVAGDAQKAAVRKTVETCGTCHGVNGRSVSPTFPNLAAQQAPYIQ